MGGHPPLLQLLQQKRQYLYKDFNERKLDRIKHHLYDMVIECLENCLPLSNKERYIELTDIVIPDIVSNYNKMLPIKVGVYYKKIRKIIEKIKLSRN